MSWIILLRDVIAYIAVALGIPGNILSAIVWLRLHVTSKNSSAIYLAVLAINDLFWQPLACLYYLIVRLHPSPWDILNSAAYQWSVNYLARFTSTFEPLLILTFSVERLIAIVRPLQVCRLRYCLLHTKNNYNKTLSS